MLTPDVHTPTQRAADPFHWDAFARLCERLVDAAAGSGEAWLVSGSEGAGKTTLLDEALPKLAHPSKRIVRVSVRHSDQLDLSGFAARVFGTALLSDSPTGADLDRLTEFLSSPSQGSTLLVVDGAHAMRAEVARYIQFAWASAPQLQIVFAARDGFRDLIERTEFAYLRSRLGPELTVPRLSDAEAARYVEHRLRQAGASTDRLLAEGAMDALVREGQGLPGRLDKLQEIAIEIGVLRTEARVTPISVLQASTRMSQVKREIAEAPRVAFGRAPPSGNALMVIPQSPATPRPRPVVIKTPVAERPLPKRKRVGTIVALALLTAALVGGAYAVGQWTRLERGTAEAVHPGVEPPSMAATPAVTPEAPKEASSAVVPPAIDPPPVIAVSPVNGTTAPSAERVPPPEPAQPAQPAPAAETSADEAALAQARAEYFRQAAALGDAAAKRQIEAPAAPGTSTP